jgi:hypothetical protein
MQDNEKNIVTNSSTIVNNNKITAEPVMISHVYIPIDWHMLDVSELFQNCRKSIHMKFPQSYKVYLKWKEAA